MENLDSVMRRIQKLLAIASDSRANPEEAASAASMAEKTMRKYQIENADLIKAQMQSATVEEFGIGGVYGSTKPTVPSKTLQVWAAWLSMAIGKYNDCIVSTMQYRSKEKVILFKGYKPDVEVSKHMFCYIVGIMEQSGKNQEWSDDMHGREYMSSYRQGFVLAVIEKINKEIAKKKEEMQAESSSRSLIVLKEQLVQQKFGVQGYAKSHSRTGSADGFSAGAAAGARVDIGKRGIGQQTNSMRLN